MSMMDKNIELLAQSGAWNLSPTIQQGEKENP